MKISPSDKCAVLNRCSLLFAEKSDPREDAADGVCQASICRPQIHIQALSQGEIVRVVSGFQFAFSSDEQCLSMKERIADHIDLQAEGNIKKLGGFLRSDGDADAKAMKRVSDFKKISPRATA